MKRKHIFVKIFQFTITMTCFIFFLMLMSDGWEKFRHKTAHTGIVLIPSQVTSKLQTSKRQTSNVKRQTSKRQTSNVKTSKLLPCISFCTQEGFKRRGYFSNESSFLENSFSAEEIFHPTSISEFKDVSRFSVKATNNLIAGRCYTVCSLQLANQNDGTWIYLRQKLNLVLYVHTSGDEFWLNGANDFPVKIEIAELKIEDNYAGSFNFKYLQLVPCCNIRLVTEVKLGYNWGL
jgi:hypothetical protein